MRDEWPASLTLSALTYTVNYFNATHRHPVTSIAHAWSLAVEEQFYLLWPLVFIALARRGRLVHGVIAIAALSFAWRTVLVFAGTSSAWLYNAFDTRMDCLAIGCLVAIIQLPAAHRLGAKAWYPFVTIAALVASRVAPSEAYHYSAGFTVEAVLCAVLLVQMMQLSPVSAWRFLDHPVMRYLGLISYPMYLYHAIGGAFGRRMPGSNPTIEFTGTLAATILIRRGATKSLKGRFSGSGTRGGELHRRRVPFPFRLMPGNPYRAIEPTKIPVKRAEGDVSSAARKLDNQTIGEADGRVAPEVGQCQPHDLGIVHHYRLMIEEQFDAIRNLRWCAAVDGGRGLMRSGTCAGQAQPAHPDPRSPHTSTGPRSRRGTAGACRAWF
jgi:hypothetical protein